MPSIDPSLLSEIRYRCIGPTRGGRVVAVAADPHRPAIFYFGAVAGGVWRSEDAGLYWENITDGQLNTASIGALAVAPSDSNVIYAGTGETAIRIDVTHGDGMYRSTDAGRHWTHLGLTETRHIGEIRVHPDNPDLVYVAALGHSSKDNPERGVYRSYDGGDTWELVLHVSDRAGAVDLSMDPGNPRILFATIWQARRTFWSIDSGGPDCGLWRSLDGGDTWQIISNNPGFPTGTLGKMGVAASPAQSGRVWAMVEAEGRTRGLYRSDDVGDTWTKASSKPELGWRPWYYQHVIAHPTEPDTVFVFNMSAWRSTDGGTTFEKFHTPHGDNHALWIDPIDPDRMIGCDDGGAWVSLNGGHSWSTIYNQPTAQFYHVAVDDQYPYHVYGSQQDNSSVAVPSRTGTGAINWGDCYPAGTAESGYVATKPGDSNIVFVGAIGSSPGGGDALQRYDHTTKQIQLISVWPELVHDGNSAEVRFQWTYPIVFSPQDPNVLYACGNKVFRSVDEGMSWEAISPDLTYADPETMGVSGPLTMDTAGAEMYATIFSFVASAHRDGVLMAGSDDGLVHVLIDGGWRDATPPDLPRFSQITMLSESPHHDGTVYLTAARHKMGDYGPYVYKTTDFGERWTRIDDGLPSDDFCRVIREDPNRPDLLYLGTELGLFLSIDGGDSWQPLQANLPVCPVYDLVVKNTDLVVATHGRSFWILDDLTQIHQLADQSMGQPEPGTTDPVAPGHLFTPRDTVRAPTPLFGDAWSTPGGKNYHVTLGHNATFYAQKSDTGHLKKQIIDAGEDIERGVRFTYRIDHDMIDGARTPIALTVLWPDGTEIETFTSDIPADEDDRHGLYLSANDGMNSFQWPMRAPDGVQMVDTDFHKRPGGPLLPPGRYQARLTIGAWSMTTDFSLVRDPRITTSDEDFAKQFDLLINIRDTLTDIALGVNRCRDLKNQWAAWKTRLTDDHGAADLLAGVDRFVEQLDAVEAELVQAELTSEGDSLNHREKLFEKLGALAPVVASADTAPTAQSYRVYDKLAGQAAQQLAALDALCDGDLNALNQQLAHLGVAIVGTASVASSP